MKLLFYTLYRLYRLYKMKGFLWGKAKEKIKSSSFLTWVTWVMYAILIGVILVVANSPGLKDHIEKTFSLEVFVSVYAVCGLIFFALYIFLAEYTTRKSSQVYTIDLHNSIYAQQIFVFEYLKIEQKILFYLLSLMTLLTLLVFSSGQMILAIAIGISTLIIFLCVELIIKVMIFFNNDLFSYTTTIINKYVENIQEELANKKYINLPTVHPDPEMKNKFYEKQIKYVGRSGYTENADYDSADKIIKEITYRISKIEQHGETKYNLSFSYVCPVSRMTARSDLIDRIENGEVLYYFEFYIDDRVNIRIQQSIQQEINHIFKELKVERKLSTTITTTKNRFNTISDKEFHNIVDLMSRVHSELVETIISGNLYQLRGLFKINDLFLEKNVYRFISLFQFFDNGQYLKNRKKHFTDDLQDAIPQEIIKRADRYDFNTMYNFYFLLLCRHAIPNKDSFVTETLLRGLLNFTIFNHNSNDRDFQQYVVDTIFDALIASSGIGRGINHYFNNALSLQYSYSREEKEKTKKFVFGFFNAVRYSIFSLCVSQGRFEDSIRLLEALDNKFIEDPMKNRQNEILKYAQETKFEVIKDVCAHFHHNLPPPYNRPDESQKQRVLGIFKKQLVDLSTLENIQIQNGIKASWVIQKIKKGTNDGLGKMLAYVFSQESNLPIDFDDDGIDEWVESGELSISGSIESLLESIFDDSGNMKPDIQATLQSNPQALEFFERLNNIQKETSEE